MVWLLSSRMWPGRPVIIFPPCYYPWIGGKVHMLLLLHCLLHRRAVRKPESGICRLNTPQILTASSFTCWHISISWTAPIVFGIMILGSGVNLVPYFSQWVRKSMAILFQMKSGLVCNDLQEQEDAVGKDSNRKYDGVWFWLSFLGSLLKKTGKVASKGVGEDWLNLFSKHAEKYPACVIRNKCCVTSYVSTWWNWRLEKDEEFSLSHLSKKRFLVAVTAINQCTHEEQKNNELRSLLF